MKAGWAVAVLTAVLLIAGCMDRSLDDQVTLIAGGGDVPAVKLTAISPTPSSMLRQVEVEIKPGSGGYDVAVRTVEFSDELSEFFFSLEYDAMTNHVLGLKNDVVDEKYGVIGIAVEGAPGFIDFGVMEVNHDNLPDTSLEQLAAGDVLLSFKLLPGAGERVTSSVTSGNRARARNLNLVQNDDGNWMLSWDYTNPGDNNQDGLVNISDLTAIGYNYLGAVSNNWDDPLRHIDTNSDGEINMSDITAIGQNYAGEIFAYQIEMWDEGQDQFIVVGQFLMGDQDIKPGETFCFEYVFAAQYVEGAYYRVIPLDKQLVYGSPSEQISEEGRRMEAVNVASGGNATITISIHDLPKSITNMNACRVIYPDSFTYVVGSFNPGSTGGSRDTADGIWGGFSPMLLLPPESLLMESDMGGGMKAIDFNVSAVMPDLPGSPVGFGELFNFQLKSEGGDDLTLEFQDVSEDGIKRTYFSTADLADHFFGNAIGFTVQ